MKNRVLVILKPKVASFGLSKEEVESVAAEIANNLASNADATEEDINGQINSVIPYLKISQKMFIRGTEEAKRKIEKKETEDSLGSKTKKTEESVEGEEAPAWFVKSQKTMMDRLEAIERKEESESRNGILTARFKDMDAEFVETAMFGRTFESDEQLEAFATHTEEKWKVYEQKLADEGLSRMGKPSGGDATTKGTEESIASFIEQGTKEIVEQSKK